MKTPTTPRSPETDELLRTLQQREEWFRAVFEGSAMGIAVVDMTGRFIDANAAFLRMVGRTAEEMKEVPFASLDHEDDQERDSRLFRRLFVAGLGLAIFCFGVLLSTFHVWTR